MLPKAMFRVQLDQGGAVRASFAPKARHAIVRLIAGDRVELELSSHDPKRAHIIRKL